MPAGSKNLARGRKAAAWNALNAQIVACEQCTRLRTYCGEIASKRRRAFAEWDYWGRPVPNFGDPQARLLIVGLAPAAHGANRTGRLFTGDRSGDWLYRALHKAGFANQPTAVSADDGLELSDCAINGIAHCAPPDNKPAPDEVVNCRTWLSMSFDVVPARVYLALGGIAFKGTLEQLRQRGLLSGRTPKFAHGAQFPLAGNRWLLASYHPSQQNTFTGRLTEPMFDAVFAQARRLLAGNSLCGVPG